MFFNTTVVHTLSKSSLSPIFQCFRMVSESSKSSWKVDNLEKEELKPGEGLRSLRTSAVFRTLNFELYTKPNKYMMAFGLITVSGCFGYIAYMNYYCKKENVYTAINDDDQLVLSKKKSHWD